MWSAGFLCPFLKPRNRGRGPRKLVLEKSENFLYPTLIQSSAGIHSCKWFCIQSCILSFLLVMKGTHVSTAFSYVKRKTSRKPNEKQDTLASKEFPYLLDIALPYTSHANTQEAHTNKRTSFCVPKSHGNK